VAENSKSIREMCSEFKVTPRTLRFYEAKELLSPLREGTHRMFTRRDSARLKLILQGKRFGFSLEEIRQLLNMYDIDDQQATQWKETYRIGNERLADMKKQSAELTEAIEDLKTQLARGEKLIEKASKNNQTNKTPLN
jgi:DNA-binding transcriptional MerR regulator